MNKDQCCNHDCNQGRNFPVREGTHKPAEAVHQIQEPTVNHQLTIEREAFGIPQCPFPCGWKNLHTLLVAEGAFLARSLQEDEPITDHQRATVMRVVNYGLEMARAALAATPAAAPTDEPVFLQRLRVEQQELDARQQKLGAFIESSEFRLLSETDAALLSKQEALQHVLLQTLNQRIHSASEKHMREKRNA